MAKIVSSWNDWDPLKRVIVGRCDNSVIPPEEPATSEKVPVDSEMRGMWGLRPSDTVARGNECLENLVKILEDRGVVVDRPTPLQWNQAIGTPDFRNDSMMTCMPPRDILLTIGNEIMAAANSFRCRYFEYLAYWPLMEEYFEQDPDFKWTQAPRPRPRLTDRSYKHNYYDEKITLEERLVRTANKDFVTTEVEPMWDAADVMRMGKDLFIQHGLTTNRAAMDWFQRYYPEYRVHAVNFPGLPDPHRRDLRAAAPGPDHQQPAPPAARAAARHLRGQRLADRRGRPARAHRAAGAVLLLRVAVHELPGPRPEDRHRGGLRGASAGADGQAGHERHPLRPARRLPVRRRPALLHRRRLPRGRVPRLLPEPRRGSHPRAPRDVEVSTTFIVGSQVRKAA